MRFAVHRRHIRVEGVTFGLGGGREFGIHGIPEQIHRVAAHIADLSGAEVPEHVPGEAVRTGSTREVGRIVGMEGRRAEPEVIMEAFRRCAFFREVAGLRNLAITPRVGGFQLADGPIADEFLHAVEIRLLMALHADLRGEFALFRLPRRTDSARLVHRDGQRLLAVAMQVTFQRPIGDESMRVVRRADDDGVEVFVIKAFAPVDVSRGTWEALQCVWKTRLIDVTQRNNVFLRNGVVMRKAAAPHPDEGDVEFVAGGVLAEQRTGNHTAGDEASRADEAAA